MTIPRWKQLGQPAPVNRSTMRGTVIGDGVTKKPRPVTKPKATPQGLLKMKRKHHG
jgi:hypothetical protein